MTSRMYRYRVVVSDRPQTFELTASPVHVAADRVGVGPDAEHVVDFWAEFDEGALAVPRTFQVYGTGHELPESARHCGTTARTPEGLVWHLYELPSEGP